jgi:hypothetical protein
MAANDTDAIDADPVGWSCWVVLLVRQACLPNVLCKAVCVTTLPV